MPNWSISKNFLRKTMTIKKLSRVSGKKVRDTPTEYFSKWRKRWIKFKRPPGELEIKELLKYKYKLR